MRVLLRGPDAAGLLEPLSKRVGEPEPDARKGAGLRFVVVGPSDPVPTGEAAADVLGVVESGGAGIRLVSAAPAPVQDVERPDALVPIWFAGDVFAGARLPMRPDSRARGALALSLLLAQDAAGASTALADAPDDLGVRVLRAFAAVCLRDFPAAHRLAKGLETDPDVGALVHFLVGAALFGDGETRESTRDFVAAAGLKPGFWPATLYAAAANHRMGLRDEALAGYDAVLALSPGRVEALLGRAACLAKPEPAAALAILYRLVRDHPTLSTAWARIAALRHEGDRDEDVNAEAVALSKLTALRPRDRDAWEGLAMARWEQGRRGEGGTALRGAAEGFARSAALAMGPAAALSTFNRGAALHQWALLPPPDLDVRAARERLAEAKSAYEAAITLGLPPEQAAQAHFNRGLAIDLLAASDPAGGGAGAPLPAAPAGAVEAFEAARAADARYVPPALALVGVRIATGDADAASKALDSLPIGASPDSQELFAAAIDALRGDEARVRAYLVKSAPEAKAVGDPIALLALRLTEAGYARGARTVLGASPKTVVRLVERVRADARLWDAASARADLARLESLDAAAAASLRVTDSVLRAVLLP